MIVTRWEPVNRLTVSGEAPDDSEKIKLGGTVCRRLWSTMPLATTNLLREDARVLAMWAR